MRLALAPILAVLPLAAQQSPMDFLNHNRPVPDAHNCYPYKGQWKDRIDRALRTPFPVAIEQDIAWARGEPVVSHDAKTTGGEPSLRAHFFERVRPIVEKAVADNDRASWPIIVLHFDFKSVQPELLQAVWDLLGEYQGWITTAEKTADPRRLSPFDPKPLLVLTEDADAQEEVFFKQVPAGGRLRVFGSAHTGAVQAANRAEREHLQATLPPDRLLTQPPTNYRRWWNNSWFVVEEGGQHKAGDWTPADDRRLRALVDHAHKLGYWIRFYTLDGFAPAEEKGWGDTYNFGSREAVMLRWKAAVAAGVNLISSDQYEDLAAVIR
ncbi:MAG TPA: hypothetical protein VMJ75_17095 [Candidatus Acidoferrales bacterium]|nr:hypothetical protein [Candidatus Acidoferrales bacterium]